MLEKRNGKICLHAVSRSQNRARILTQNTWYRRVWQVYSILQGQQSIVAVHASTSKVMGWGNGDREGKTWCWKVIHGGLSVLICPNYCLSLIWRVGTQGGIQKLTYMTPYPDVVFRFFRFLGWANSTICIQVGVSLCANHIKFGLEMAEWAREAPSCPCL